MVSVLYSVVLLVFFLEGDFFGVVLWVGLDEVILMGLKV